MIGHFSQWLKKKKEKGNEDVKLVRKKIIKYISFTNINILFYVLLILIFCIQFQEIGDYLDTSGKLYSYRVDNLSETTSKLIEQFRAVNYKQSILNEDNENEPQKSNKPKVNINELICILNKHVSIVCLATETKINVDDI